jgi:hypothetical protein
VHSAIGRAVGDGVEPLIAAEGDSRGIRTLATVEVVVAEAAVDDDPFGTSTAMMSLPAPSRISLTRTPSARSSRAAC